MFNLQSRYASVPGVKFRSEDFGGIVYVRKTDQLIFLKSPLAIELLSLANRGTVKEIISLVIESAALPNLQNNILKVLSSLKEMGIIYELAD